MLWSVYGEGGVEFEFWMDSFLVVFVGGGSLRLRLIRLLFLMGLVILLLFRLEIIVVFEILFLVIFFVLFLFIEGFDFFDVLLL